MKEILILGALPKTATEQDIYQTMVDVCGKYAQIVNSPLDTIKFEGDNAQRYQRAKGLVETADLIIGEQSKPSTGQGIEIGHADYLKKPLVVVAEEGSSISGLVKGCPILQDTLYYLSKEDLESKLTKFLDNYTQIKK